MEIEVSSVVRGGGDGERERVLVPGLGALEERLLEREGGERGEKGWMG